MSPFAFATRDDYLLGKYVENSKQMRLLWFWDYLTKQFHSTDCNFIFYYAYDAYRLTYAVGGQIGYSS